MMYIIHVLVPGASKEIRAAITTPSDETESSAWDAVIPLVEKLAEFFLFSKELDSIVPKILLALCSPPAGGQNKINDSK